MIAVKYDDLEDAFDFVSAAPPTECNAYIALDTGRIYWVSELTGGDEDAPDDLEESDRYMAIPHKYDLDLGQELVMRFVDREIPDSYNEVEKIFRRKGAYRKFKEFLAGQDRLEDWYDFEAEETEKALRRWCADNDIQLVDKGAQPTT